MNPKRSGSHTYPTGQRLNTSLALKSNKHKWQRSAKLIHDIVEKIPSERIYADETAKASKSEKRTATLKANRLDIAYLLANVDRPVEDVKADIELFATNGHRYEYTLNPTMMDSTMDAFYRIMVEQILGGSDVWNTRFFMNSHINQSVIDGVTDSFESALLITEGVSAHDKIAIMSVEQQLSQPAYYERIALVNSRVFESMKGLVGDMKAQLRVTLTEGMARGLGIRDIKGMINDRLGVGMSRAERIARTEINNAYRSAYLQESDDLNKTLNDSDDEWNIMQVHRSALSPTTRPNHASRHGTVHTSQQQKDWWSTGSNAIMCLCSTLDVLINKVTGEILQQDMIDTMLKQKKQWFPTK